MVNPGGTFDEKQEILHGFKMSYLLQGENIYYTAETRKHLD